jgi:ribose transport system permease protein
MSAMLQAAPGAGAPSSVGGRLSVLREQLTSTELLAPGAWVLSIVLYVATCFVSRGFFSVAHTQELVGQASVLGMLAISQTFVLLVGGVDLSVPWTMTTAAIIVNSMAPSTGLPVALAVALAASLGVGIVNGLGVSGLGMSPIIVTLATNGILDGGVSSLVGGSGFINSPPSLVSFTSANPLGVPDVVWVWLGLAVVTVAVLKRTLFGRYVYASGSSQRVAWLSGVRWRPIVAGCYAVSGLVAGLTGVLLAGTLSQTYLGMGDSYLFPSIAAAVLGGISIYGGAGGYIGPFGGALAITSLDFLLSAFGMSSQAQEVAFGIVLLVAIAVPRAIELKRGNS